MFRPPRFAKIQSTFRFLVYDVGIDLTLCRVVFPNDCQTVTRW